MKKLFWRLLKKEKKAAGRFTALRPEPLLATIEKLEKRILERFPQSGLGRVCAEFRAQAEADVALAERLSRPDWQIRIFSWAVILGLFWAIFHAFRLVFEKTSIEDGGLSLAEFLQGLESAINEMVFLGIAIFFLSNLEMRRKRRSALRSLHRLRSLAHVVDMHQLTKDPTVLLAAKNVETESSPMRGFSPFELSRYLDYCSELLSLIAKTAALFSQEADDTELLASVSDLENLTASLSSKIWQKIMILDSAIEHRG